MSLSDLLPANVLNKLPDVKTYPIGQWHPKQVAEIAIYIDEKGQWFYRGSPFCRKKMITLFSRLLRKEGQQYYLVTPVEKLLIRVEDVPFMVSEFHCTGQGREQFINLTTTVGDTVIVSHTNPLHMSSSPLIYGGSQQLPYVRIRNALEAKLHRNVFYQLADKAEEVNNNFGAWSAGVFWQLA